jgi:ABC-type lipoprotein release transport system permease subunit
MEKHRKILEYTLSSLLRRRYKNFAIIAVFSFVIAVLSSILFLTHSFKIEAFNVLIDAPELIVQKVSGGRHDLIPTEYMEDIQGIYGVGSVIPRYWGYYYDSKADSNYTIMGIDRNIRGLKLSENGESTIGKGVAEVMEIGIGETMRLTDSDGYLFTSRIVGIFTADSELLTNDLILLTKEDAIEFFVMPPDRATDIVVKVFNKNEIPSVASKIKFVLPDTRPIMKSEIIRTYDTLFNWRSGMILTMFSGALIAFCILAWDKATGLSADERQEIGILKAIGWETSDILELKFWEGVVISLTSFLTGIILAYIHVYLFGASLLAPALKGWSVLFPSFRLIPYISLYHIFTVLFLTVIPYIASTIIPSWKAAITDPDVAMRG